MANVVSEAALTTASALVAPRADLEEIVRRSDRALRKLAGRRLLIAGAGGFLGAYLARAVAHANDVLLEKSCSLVLLDNFATGSLGRLAGLDGRRDCEIVHRPLEQLDRIEPDSLAGHGKNELVLLDPPGRVKARRKFGADGGIGVHCGGDSVRCPAFKKRFASGDARLRR